MDLKKINVIAKEGDKPAWQTVLGAVLLVIGVVQILIMVSRFWEDDTMSALDNLEIALLTLLFGIKFSISIKIYFDIAKRRYKKQYAVGPLKYGKWEHLPNIEYISVFRQGLTDSDGDRTGVIYDVNVWYNTSKHFTIYTSPDLEPAYEMARYMAIKLEVDFLDATNPADKHWVELYKETAADQI